MSERAIKAIRFMLRNEDDSWDKKARLENLSDGAGDTFIGCTNRDDSKYLPPPLKSMADLASLYIKDKQKAIAIVIDLYTKHYWSPKFDLFINERLAIRTFDLGVNMGPTTSIKLLQRSLIDLGAKIDVDGKLGDTTISLANIYSVDDSLIKIYKTYTSKLVEDLKDFFLALIHYDVFKMFKEGGEIIEVLEDIFKDFYIDDDTNKELYLEALSRYKGIAEKPKFTRFLIGWKNRLNRDEYAV